MTHSHNFPHHKAKLKIRSLFHIAAIQSINWKLFFIFLPLPPFPTYRTTEKHNWLSVIPKTKWEQNSQDVEIFFVFFFFPLSRHLEKRKTHRSLSPRTPSLKHFAKSDERKICCFPRRESLEYFSGFMIESFYFPLIVKDLPVNRFLALFLWNWGSFHRTSSLTNFILFIIFYICIWNN